MSQDCARRIRAYLLIQFLALGLASTTPASDPLTHLQESRPSNAAPISQQSVTELQLGEPIEREMKARETHLYGITMSAGQFLYVVVNQRGIDVVVTLFGPDGKQIVEVDRPNDIEGPEPVLAVTEKAGMYRLEVRSLDEAALPGRYEVKIVELQAATSRDKSRVAAQRAYMEGTRLQFQGTAETLRLAIKKYEEALFFFRETGNTGWQATTLNIISQIYYALGENQKALDSLTQALALFRAIGDMRGEAMVLSNLGAVYDDLGEPQKALDSFEQALAFLRAIGDRSGEVETLNNIGALYSSLGENQKAIDIFERALSDRLALAADSRGEAVTLNNIGAAYSALGNKQRALDYYNQALPIYHSIGDLSGEAVVLSNLGAVYDTLGGKQKALEYYSQALSLCRAAGDRRGEATTLNNIGKVYSDLGEKQKALDFYTRALTLRREVEDRGGEAATLTNIGAAYGDLGERQKALDYYNQALPIMVAIGDRKGEANALFRIGTLYESAGDPVKALNFYLQAIAIRERLRSTLSTAGFNINFDEESAEIYQRAILIYVSAGQADLAFNLSERMRARHLLDQLSAAPLSSRSERDTQTAEREAALRQQMSSLEREIRKERAKPESKIDQNLLQQLERRLSLVQREYEELISRIKQTVPEAGSPRSADTVTLSEVQKLLVPDITLLSYLVTPDKTIAFVISRDSFRAVVLPIKESELTAEIRRFRGFPNLSNWQRDKLNRLYQLLIAPLERYLGSTLVGIVPHGPLHYIPFSMLSAGERYLDEAHTLFYLPSVSVFPHILKNRKEDTSLLAVAYSSAEGLPLLAFADSEAEAAARIYNGSALLGKAATEEKVRALAGGYNILHLVGHYELNTNSPLLSRLVLAPSKNGDGFLEVHEVYDLNLGKTDLVVLSGSQTQLGKQTGGDDLIGLNNAFLYAGVATVVGSLWNVDDKVTSLLMRAFYKHLKQGASKAVALQKAQAEIRVKYPHPYYWAGFVLTGDPGR